MDWFRVAAVVVGFLIVFITGFLLSRSGSPYGSALLNVHKLVAVGLLVFVVWSTFATNKAAPLGGLEWVVVSLAILVFIAIIASGGVVSAMESPPAAVGLLHKVAPYASLLLTAAWMVQLLKRAS